MKVTYAEILAAQAATQRLISNDAVSVTPLVALRLARAARVIGQEAEAFEVGRIALVNEYAPEADEQGQRIVPTGKIAEFNKRLGELAKQKIEVDVQSLDLADFGDCQVGLGIFIGMEWLIEG